VIGVGDLAETFIRRAQSHALSRTCVVGLYDDVAREHAMLSEATSRAGHPIRGDIDTLLLDCRLRNVDAVVITLPADDLGRIRQISARLRPVVADIYVVPEICSLELGPMEVDEIGATPMFPIARKPISNWRRVQKEAFDRIVSFLLLVLVGPLLLTVAVLIRLESPGPILFRQMRVGFKNNPFQILKFRTMFHHLNDRVANQQTGRADQRVTRIGRILRKLSIDELPQLINVLRGDMSLVGPRPHAPGTSLGSRRVDEVLEDYARRHRVKPGITGLAQVCGCRGEMVTEEQVMRRVRFDIEYIERWSMWLDLKILFLTLRREIYSRNAF
jgi:Undecaprenyl-phosphate glucose phosphotransferase